MNSEPSSGRELVEYLEYCIVNGLYFEINEQEAKILLDYINNLARNTVITKEGKRIICTRTANQIKTFGCCIDGLAKTCTVKSMAAPKS